MTSISVELEAVLARVVLALEREDSGDAFAAVDCYQQASTQLQRATDLLVSSDQPLMLDLCKDFLDGYSQRMQTLAAAAQARASDAAANTAADQQQRVLLRVANDNSSASTAWCEDDDLMQIGSAVDASEHPDQQQSNAQWMEILQQCQKIVSGSLDDINGLE